MTKITITDKPQAGDTIAKNINRYMSHYKISRSELANRLNVSKATVGYWCTGKKIPRMAKIDEMCKIFNVQRKHLVSDNNYVIGRVVKPTKYGTIEISVSPKNTAPRLSELKKQADKNLRIAGLATTKNAVITNITPEEVDLIVMYRQKKYKEIINLMMDKMTEGS